MSSTAQPVTGIDPATPCELSSGVSNAPTGASPADLTVSVIATFCGALVMPLPATATVAVYVPRPGSEAESSATVNPPLPVPAPPITFSHGWPDTATHAVAGEPGKLTVTSCGPVAVMPC